MITTTRARLLRNCISLKPLRSRIARSDQATPQRKRQGHSGTNQKNTVRIGTPFLLRAQLLVLSLVAYLLLFTPAGLAQGWFATGQNADLMLSGIDFNQTGGGILFNHPSGLDANGNRLLLCDRFNNRVLVWTSLPTTWNTPPNLVLGQQDMTSNDPSTAKSGLNWPGNVSVASNGVVAVADTENDRILIWTTFPTISGQSANVSIHLPTISPPAADRWEWPWGVWTDGNRLAVTATQGSAILFWNTMPILDNTAPSFTIKEPEFGTPRGISTDGSTYFFVGDHNAKLPNVKPATFFWNNYPTGASDRYDFTREEWLKGTKLPDGRLFAAGLANLYSWTTMPTTNTAPSHTYTPTGYDNGDGPDIAYSGGKLWANNYNGNNVLVYQAPPTTATTQPDYAIGAPSLTSNTLDTFNYIQNPVLASDGTRLFVTSDFDRTLHVWDSLPTSTGQSPNHKLNLIPHNLFPWDNAIFANQFVVAGKFTVGIWDNLPTNAQPPTRVYANQIGTAVFQNLQGVALDSQWFYLGDANGKLYGWNGIPTSTSTNPAFVVTFPSPINHLHSDGTYLTVTLTDPPSKIHVFKVSDLGGNTPVAFKTVANSPSLKLNLPTEAITFGDSLAIANSWNGQVLLWQNLSQAADPNFVTVLGQPSLSSTDLAIGRNRLFAPWSLLSTGNQLWVGELKFSSRIVRFSRPHASTIRNWNQY